MGWQGYDAVRLPPRIARSKLHAVSVTLCQSRQFSCYACICLYFWCAPLILCTCWVPKHGCSYCKVRERKAAEEAERKRKAEEAEAERKRKAAEEAERKRKAAEEAEMAERKRQAEEFAPWFEIVGLKSEDAVDLALACVLCQVRCPVSLCMMPEVDCCRLFEKLPPGLLTYIPIILKATRDARAARLEVTPATPPTGTREWLKQIGLDETTTLEVCVILEHNHIRSKGIALTQTLSEMEQIGAQIPAGPKHVLLAAIRDARTNQQFQFGNPPRQISAKFAQPVVTYLRELKLFDDVTIQQVDVACQDDGLKIRTRWSLLALEDLEVHLSRTTLPLAVRRPLIDFIRQDADQIATRLTVDFKNPGAGGVVKIYSHDEWKEEKRLQEEEKEAKQTYEHKGMCAFSSKCRKCNKKKSDHHASRGLLYCNDYEAWRLGRSAISLIPVDIPGAEGTGVTVGPPQTVGPRPPQKPSHVEESGNRVDSTEYRDAAILVFEQVAVSMNLVLALQSALLSYLDQSNAALSHPAESDQFSIYHVGVS